MREYFDIVKVDRLNWFTATVRNGIYPTGRTQEEVIMEVSNRNLVKARGLKYFIKNRTPSKLSSNSIPYVSSNIEYYLDILIQYANYDLENENRIRKLNGLKVRTVLTSLNFHRAIEKFYGDFNNEKNL